MIHHHVKGLRRVLFAYSPDSLIRYDIETRSLYRVDFEAFRAQNVTICQEANSLGFWVSTQEGQAIHSSALIMPEAWQPVQVEDVTAIASGGQHMIALGKYFDRYSS